LPYAYGLEASVITQDIETINHEFNFEVNKINFNSMGYIFDWKSLDDAQFLAKLLNNNFKVRYTTKTVTTNGKKIQSRIANSFRQGSKYY